jgi:hypothetical protein
MSSIEALQRPLLSTHTDEKVDPKVELVPSDQLPPSYQAASEAPPPPPADSELAESRCCRHRRLWRRFGHFFIPVAVVLLWLTTRYVVRHCQQRRFDHPDDVSIWVGYLAIRSN